MKFINFLSAGGYTTGPKELIALLRQKSRPYLFSNTLPPPVVASADKVYCRKMTCVQSTKTYHNNNRSV